MKLLILCSLLTGCLTGPVSDYDRQRLHEALFPPASGGTAKPTTCTTNAGLTQCW